MTKSESGQSRRLTRRATLSLGMGAATIALGIRPAFATQTIRIGLATKTWWPSVIAETAQARGLFAKAGLSAELTIYRSGGEAFEALAAGATDMITGVVSQMGTGRKRGVNSKIIALGSTANTGWKLLVTTASPVRNIAELAGKKVGITASGSLSDFMALWTRSHAKVDFTSVPLGGGGLVPNLLSGNVDAAIVYSPLSFQMLQAGQVREIIDFAAVLPAHLAVGWATTDAIIDTKADLVRRGLSALYDAVNDMRSDGPGAIARIAEINGIAQGVAKQEYEETFLKLSTDGRFDLDQTRVALDLARIGGFQNLASAEEIVSMAFTPVASSA